MTRWHQPISEASQTAPAAFEVVGVAVSCYDLSLPSRCKTVAWKIEDAGDAKDEKVSKSKNVGTNIEIKCTKSSN